jgi:hypothetical protein
MSNLVPLASQSVSGGLQINSMDDLARLGKMLASSGFFSDCTDAAQAGAKILCGLELGIPAFSAMSGIYIVKGKATLGANLMAAKIKASGKYNYRILEHTDEVCKIAFFEGKEQVGVSEFTAKDAQRMGTQNMGKMPKNMLFARALSNGVRWFAPDIFLGAPVYTPEELGVQVNEDGEVISVPSVEIKQPPASQLSPRLNAAANLNRKRIATIQKLSGQNKEKCSEIWVSLNIPTDSSALNETQLQILRNALFVDWAMGQGVFNAPQHAYHAFNKLMAEAQDSMGDDQAVWVIWKADIERRKAEQESVAVEADVVEADTEEF